MGCITSKPRVEEPAADDKNSYSWSKREKVDPKDFTIENLVQDQVEIRKPGTVNGQQFIIQNCSGASIAVFDHCATVTVDDCHDCTIFLGPTRGSVSLRNCVNCRIMCASQQFRTRDCRCLDVFLLCTSKPSIEASHELRFGCFSFFYRELADQFKEAGISVFNNKWHDIYDFNAMDGEDHFSLFTRDQPIEELFKSIANIEGCQRMDLSIDSVLSVVPLTWPNQRSGTAELDSLPSDQQTCLVMFFSDGNREKRARAFIREMEHQSCWLIATREFTATEQQGQQIFGTDSYASVLKRGPILALEYFGQDSIKRCQDVAKSIALETGSTGLVYVSSTTTTANRQHGLVFEALDS